jgi:hypothetical protein
MPRFERTWVMPLSGSETSKQKAVTLRKNPVSEPSCEIPSLCVPCVPHLEDLCYNKETTTARGYPRLVLLTGFQSRVLE